MIATARLTDDDLQVLRDAKRDRLAANRPAQLEERARLVAALVVDPDAVKRERDHADEVKAAERAVAEIRVNLRRAEDRVSDLWRQSHGRSHGRNIRDAGVRDKLRQSTHPAVAFVIHQLTQIDFAACGVHSSVIAIDHSDEVDEPTPEQARKWWEKPFTRTTHRPVTSHTAQLALLEAIRSARTRADDLYYADINDDAVVARLRAELDTIVAVAVPLPLAHIHSKLVALRRRLDPDALSLWQIAEDAEEQLA
jgi:hypothetical protein